MPSHFQARDTSGPMDIDDVNPFSRVAEYALPPGYQDGPSRKRLHSEHSTIHDPFLQQSQSQHQGLRFGPNTPFLFHAPPLPPAQKFEPYDPNRWARADFGFGAGTGANGASGSLASFGGGTAPDSETSVAVRDIEMGNGESPARLEAQNQRGGQESQVLRGTINKSASTSQEEQSGDRVGEVGKEEGNGKANAERPIAHGAVTRVRKKRQKEWSAARQRRQRDADSDTEEYRQKRDDDQVVGRLRENQRSELHYNLHMSAPTVRHSEIPAILLGYVQFVFNGSLVLGFLYIAIQFILAVRRDVQDRIEEYSVEYLQEIASCTNMYLTNRCEPSLRVPAMESACSAWELCMNRDPTVVGRARVGAETFAGVINSFVDPISWKTMGFTLVTLTFLIVLTNSALFNLRARHQNQYYQYQSQSQPPSQPHLHSHTLYPPTQLDPTGTSSGQWGYSNSQSPHSYSSYPGFSHPLVPGQPGPGPGGGLSSLKGGVAIPKNDSGDGGRGVKKGKSGWKLFW